MDTSAKISKQNVGNAGEYYIASRLSLENFVTTITLGRAERYDILALSPSGRTVKLSVKSRRDDDHFQLNKKDENAKGDERNFYYAFVNLRDFKQSPDFWIIPGRVVRNVIGPAYKKWLAAKNRHGQPHRDNPGRTVPMRLTKGDRLYYPASWERTVEKYRNRIPDLLR